MTSIAVIFKAFLQFLAVRPADMRRVTEQDTTLREKLFEALLIDRLSSQNSDFVPAIPPDRQHVSTSSIDPLCPIYFPVRPFAALTRCDGSFEGAVIDNRPSSLSPSSSLVERRGGLSPKTRHTQTRLTGK